MRLASPRLTPLARDQWVGEVREALNTVNGGVGGPDNPINIFTTLARHPKLLKRFLVFGNHILFDNSLEPRHRQLLILRTGFICRSKYEWGHHVEISKKCGISDAEIAQVIQGPSATAWSEAEAALLQATDELHEDRMIEDDTWSLLTKHFSEQQCIEIVFTVGQYMLVSMALNCLGVQLDPGVSSNLEFAE